MEAVGGGEIEEGEEGAGRRTRRRERGGEKEERRADRRKGKLTVKELTGLCEAVCAVKLRLLRARGGAAVEAEVAVGPLLVACVIVSYQRGSYLHVRVREGRRYIPIYV